FMMNYFLRFYKTRNVTVETYQEYPRASGLGGSAAHATAIIKALDSLHNRNRDQHDAALFAYDVERKKLGVDGGYQDQFATNYRGFNYMIFRPESVEVNNIKPSERFIKQLEAVSLLVHIPRKVTGDSIQKDMKSKSVNNLEIMKKKRDLCARGRDALINSDLDGFIKLVGQDYELRKQESPLVDNEKTKEIEQIALESADVCKFLGSGGGGCALIFSRDKELTAESLRGKAKILNFRFEVI
ncbi:MAG: hypothetical protein ABIH52_03795, partial [Candidatus Aenigmatarchaeota archaeon]